MGTWEEGGIQVGILSRLRGDHPRSSGRRAKPPTDPKKQSAQTLDYLYRAGVPIATDPRDVITHFFGTGALDDPVLGRHPSPRQAAAEHRHWPAFWDSGDTTCRVLDEICRGSGARTIVETGVANGASTRMFLSALDHADGDRLVSFDCDPRCADAAIGCPGRDRWDLRLIADYWAFDDFAAAAGDLTGRVDLWYHDSNHHYDWMTREFPIALACLRPGGFLTSDDVDANIAFAELTEGRPDLSPIALFDTRKVVGFARLPLA